ncbi:putative aldouronate transport system permease protein [Streptomyces mirabilis]|uniref:Putative aldouronate transport system permease protein n=2 Tax=Streptomyces mirabilis TaxID=68239 RepID=A0A1I2HW06_9ACTN|nr:ABC transporter permease subunit [Streptomyces mirabilis]SFF32876.1 putative aldouronate transport system permease protein [Streptomyces mirabilis]
MAAVLRDHAGKEAVGPSRRPPVEARHDLKRFQRRGSRVLFLLMLPGLAYFLVFHYGALLGNVIAFKDYVPFDGIWGSRWVGLDNFRRMFEDAEFWDAVLNTLWIAVLQIVFYFPVPLALALLLHSLTRSSIRRFVQSVAYLPHFISWVIVVALFQQVLGDTGMVNSYLGDAGLHSVDIIGNPDAFKPLVVAQVVWKDAGWGTIIFLAALSQVDEQQYEAAAIDGAGPWRRFWHVTLPAIRAVIVLLLIMRLGDILSVGFEQMLLQRDAVGPQAAEIIDTFVYYQGIVGGDYGFAAAAGLFKGVVGALLVYAANKVAHRLGEQGVYR